MVTQMKSQLSDDELDRLSDFLDGLTSPQAMNIERLDGFFCALVAGPELVIPSDYWPLTIGQNPALETTATDFVSVEHAQEIMELLQCHWNGIADTLNAGEIYGPILLRDDDGVTRGNEWANGFLRGLALRRHSWQTFLDDEEAAGAIIPMFALVHENDPDPELRFDTPTPEKRTELLIHMTAGLAQIHRYFAAARGFPVPSGPFVRDTPKVGRNDPCPCGSGKKFKHCCLRQMN
jgi:uncharacterized protein